MTGQASAETVGGPSGPPLLTVVGDSFAEGRGDPARDGSWIGWAPRTAAALGIPRGRVLNIARYGAMTRDVISAQLPTARAARSPLVGVAVGGNDLIRAYSRTRFEKNFARILSVLSGSETILFTFTFPDLPTLLPLPPAVREVLRPRFEAANDYVREIAADHGALCVEVRRIPGVDDPALWSSDRLHPNAAGHALLADHLGVLLAGLVSPPPAVPVPTPFPGTVMGMGMGTGTATDLVYRSNRPD
jgi:lysophospholipase L1-like esterase